MTRFHHIIITVAMISFVLPACSQTRNVNLKIQYYRPYCGGARPTREMQEDAQKPKPYAGRTVIIMNGQKVDSIRTDEAGVIVKKMKLGTYRLIESWRYYHGTPDGAPLKNYNPECLKAEWQKEFIVLKLTSKKQIVQKQFEIFEQCDRKKPCILESALGPDKE